MSIPAYTDLDDPPPTRHPWCWLFGHRWLYTTLRGRRTCDRCGRRQQRNPWSAAMIRRTVVGMTGVPEDDERA